MARSKLWLSNDQDVPVWVEVARPHVERAVVETQVFLVSQGNKAASQQIEI